ncbi:hypothetical protein J3Q64DRAFT_1775421 [Phycomyces blakesleeanus]|uniref:Uncharacterized protein n=2 Tax=Phycomyces blakesleeanus TaxID=4837 RepID=A0A167LYQ8_PHYB8|nr:hypothetical protein PHYBLDRAFT_147857 [Phycomyces blakesleeanus NRRL 1555(-)]OAD71366.1 hypothetical protein PHYBLDRAFT_147857 [Phycomyces blakesleeanus NRRL 1555(-)]|eukprot:XP_018289406.1 hypothetical protein PHYBLDRAFT_147857 [Phycomyces blakesleeanus NRRL 1555(-)]
MLPLELILRIVDTCLDNELELYSTLTRKPQHNSYCIHALLQTNTQLNYYVSQHPMFHRLKMFRVLNRILHQTEPVPIAIYTTHDWTLLHLDWTIERLQTDKHESFLVANEARVYKKTRRWSRYNNTIYDKSVPLMSCEYHVFVDNLCKFAYQNSFSVWLWKSSPSFFKGNNMRLLTHKPPHSTICGSKCWNCHFVQLPKARPFKLIAENQGYTLMAWDRPTKDNRRFTEDVLRCNIELFGNLFQHASSY